MRVPFNAGVIAATIGATGALGGLVAMPPGAEAAAAVHRCGNHSETLEVGSPPSKLKVTIKDITAQGVTCAFADKFVGGLLKSSAVPDHFKCAIGRFKAPAGYVPESCTRHGARIQYAGPGG